MTVRQAAYRRGREGGQQEGREGRGVITARQLSAALKLLIPVTQLISHTPALLQPRLRSVEIERVTNLQRGKETYISKQNATVDYQFVVG